MYFSRVVSAAYLVYGSSLLGTIYHGLTLSKYTNALLVACDEVVGDAWQPTSRFFRKHSWHVEEPSRGTHRALPCSEWDQRGQAK